MILQACCLKVAFISTWEKTWPFIWRKLNIHFTNIFAKFAWKWPRGSKQNFKMSSMYFATVTWLKYCQYGLKLHPINQSIIFFFYVLPLKKGRGPSFFLTQVPFIPGCFDYGLDWENNIPIFTYYLHFLSCMVWTSLEHAFSFSFPQKCYQLPACVRLPNVSTLFTELYQYIHSELMLHLNINMFVFWSLVNQQMFRMQCCKYWYNICLIQICMKYIRTVF